MKLDNKNQNKETTGQPLSPVGTYSLARPIGPWLFISGQIPLDSKTGQLITGDISLQTKKVMENIKVILSSYKLNFNNIIKTSIFLTKLEDFALVNKVYGSYFNTPFPARSCVIVKALPKGAEIEIEALAYSDLK